MIAKEYSIMSIVGLLERKKKIKSNERNQIALDP